MKVVIHHPERVGQIYLNWFSQNTSKVCFKQVKVGAHEMALRIYVCDDTGKEVENTDCIGIYYNEDYRNKIKGVSK